MPNTKLFHLIPLLFFLSLQSQAQSPYAQQLRKANRQISDAYLHHDADGLMSLYTGDAVLMPEFHPALFGKKAVSDYLRSWLDSAKVSSYTRSTRDITKTGTYLVETGTFSNHFSLHNKQVDYEGKYINVWHIRPGGRLALLWEITGASNPARRADLPLSALQVPDTAHIPKPAPSKISAEIQSLNDQISVLVVHAKGREFAKYYTNDAIYAPYDTCMVIGKSAIDAYYKGHEDPRNIIGAVHIGATAIISARDYVLVNALYQVDWGSSTGAHGTVTGKNITVWKRMPDSQLLMFRQMAVHD